MIELLELLGYVLGAVLANGSVGKLTTTERACSATIGVTS